MLVGPVGLEPTTDGLKVVGWTQMPCTGRARVEHGSHDCEDRRPPLAAEVTRLRVALEMARRRLGMGLYGQDCGRDSIIAAVVEAQVILGSTRPPDEGVPLPQSAAYNPRPLTGRSNPTA